MVGYVKHCDSNKTMSFKVSDNEILKPQFADQFRIRVISQLIKDIYKVCRKLLKYFIGTAIFTPLVLLSAGVLPAIFALDLNGPVVLYKINNINIII